MIAKNRFLALTYHSIGRLGNNDPGARLYSVSFDRFKDQMNYLNQMNRPGAAPVITFDDGYIDNYTDAFPVIKKLGIQAYFFLLVERISSDGYMNWEQVKELRDSGMIIGSHGMTHKILTGLNENELDYELRDSKKILEDKLKAEINYFSVPKGHYNKRVLGKIMACGYKGAFTSNPEDRDGLVFGRISVKADWDLRYFSGVINSGLPLKERAIGFIKDSSKKILGIDRYDKIRARILKT